MDVFEITLEIGYDPIVLGSMHRSIAGELGQIEMQTKTHKPKLITTYHHRHHHHPPHPLRSHKSGQEISKLCGWKSIMRTLQMQNVPYMFILINIPPQRPGTLWKLRFNNIDTSHSLARSLLMFVPFSEMPYSQFKFSHFRIICALIMCCNH